MADGSRSTLKFEGGRELAAALEQLSGRASKSLQVEALLEAAEPMAADMEQRAPVDTGRLHRAVLFRRRRGSDQFEAAVVIGATKRAYYGSFQEFGTAHVPPQPWMRPGFDQTWQESLRILARALWGKLAGRGVKSAFGRNEFSGEESSAPITGGPGGGML